MEETTGRIAIGEADRTHLTTAAKWAKFIAIVQFVMMGIMLVCVFFILLGATVAGASFPEMSGMYGTPGLPAGFWIWYSAFLLALIAVSIFLALYLYRFAVKTLRALHEGNDSEMTEAFANLGKYFRLSGILVIISLALIPLVMIFAVIAAV